MEEVQIWSNGIAMKGALYRPPNFDANGSYPVVVCCNGWTFPTVAALDATEFPQTLAEAGYMVLTFDQRGQASSESTRMVKPDGRLDQPRDVLEPFEWATDLRHAIDYIEGEPGADPERIGIAGWSYGGGVVMYTAAHDPRVKAVVASLGGYDPRGQEDPDTADYFPQWSPEQLQKAAIDRARGAEDPGYATLDVMAWPGTQRYIAAGNQAYEGFDKINPDTRFWYPIQWADRVKVPMLVIDAELDFIPAEKNGRRAYEALVESGNPAAKYEVLAGRDHMQGYDVDSGITKLGLDWFDQHLKM